MYDATKGTADKNVMPKVTVDDLQQDDILLLECNFKRFRPPGTPGRGWTTFQVGFELLTIYILRSEDEPLRKLPTRGPSSVFTGMAD